MCMPCKGGPRASPPYNPLYGALRAFTLEMERLFCRAKEASMELLSRLRSGRAKRLAPLAGALLLRR